MRIETERLILRPYETSDYAAWRRSWLERLPAQHRYDEEPIDFTTFSQQWFADQVALYEQKALADELYIWGIFHRDGTCLGVFDVSTIARGEYQWGRFGYTIHNQFWRCGYGAEAVAAGLRYALTVLRYNRLEAHINLDNDASIGLVEKLGLCDEGIRRRFLFEEGDWVDHRIYSATAGIW